MNMNPDGPEMPKIPPKPKAGRSFEDLLNELKPKLEKLPADQKIPALPPDAMVLESVQEFVRASGMVVTESCPPTIAVAGEFLDRTQLKEGRVGFHKNCRVVSFLYRYGDKSLRAVVIYPRHGVDARKLGMSIFWGQTADVPESVAQSKILSVQDFFDVNAFDLSKILDVPALEHFKSDYRKTVDGEMRAAVSSMQAERAARLIAEKRAEAAELQSAEIQAALLQENEGANRWQLIALAAIALIPVMAVLFRVFGI